MAEMSKPAEAIHAEFFDALTPTGCETAAGLALRAATGSDLIRGVDEHTLVGLVMTLTGGSANPSTVRHHIRRVHAEQGQ